MDHRKIILFGKTALCVTLPQSWVKKYSLSKGDVLGVRETSRDSLELIPARVSADGPVTVEFSLVDRQLDEVLHFLLASYLNGFSVIILQGENAVMLPAIRDFVNELVAVEIMEVSNSRIVINLLWDMVGMQPSLAISRLDNILRTMLAELDMFFDSKYFNGIIHDRAREVRRQVLLAERSFTHALHDSSSAQKLGLSSLQLHHYALVARLLGRFGELLVELSQILEALVSSKVAIDKNPDLQVVFAGLSEFFEKIMDGLRKVSSDAPFPSSFVDLDGLSRRIDKLPVLSVGFSSFSIVVRCCLSLLLELQRAVIALSFLPR